jgi:AcrR family transcriptional regulator
LRDRIIAAALRQMNTHGIKFTTAELARELGVSKRAIYDHFTSKQHLIDCVLDTIIADLRQQISGIVYDDSLDIFDRIKALMVLNPKGFGHVNTQVIEDVRRFMPQEWAKFEKFFMERWRMLEQIIEEGSNKGLVAKVDLVILNKVYMGAIDQLLDWQFLAQNNITFNNAMIKAAEILIGGLKAPGPRPDAAGQPRATACGTEQ